MNRRSEVNDWEEEPTLGPEPRKYQPEWIDFLFSCPSTLPHHIISLSSRFHSARRVSSLHSNCFQVYDVNGSVEWRKERDTSGHRETTEAGREVKTRPRRAEWAKGGDRDERKEERSRPSLTPLAPSVRHSFGSVSSRSLTLLLPPGGAEWRGEPETRSTDEEGRRKVREETDTNGIKLTVSFTLESYHIKLLIFYFYFLVHFIIITKIRSFMIIIKELYL